MRTAYDPNPCYPPVGGAVRQGWEAVAATLPAGDLIVAIDGPVIVDWDGALDELTACLDASGRQHQVLKLDEHFAPWDRIVALTSTPELAHDNHFERLASVSIREFFDGLSEVQPKAGETIVIAGPGAALVSHDVLWYVDLPKRYAEATVRRGEGRNLGQLLEGSATSRRLFFIDWTVLDRHREEIGPQIDLWIDMQDPSQPTSLDGATLRRTADGLATRPFRTRPTFNTTPWGGQWARRELGLGQEAPNSAIGYELIAPESGVLIGDSDGLRVEVPFQLLVGLHPVEILGAAVQATFGTSFPIRFDYIDTVDGGNLSIHIHPQLDYMRKVFGWPYAQHESYYVVIGGEGRRIFLGLRGDVDLRAFEHAARTAVDQGEPFDVHDYVQTFPAEQHRLFFIPAGTPHGSGEGNVVLEVSTTPYLYSLRFYDWLRRDTDGTQRPVHVDHAFANLNRARQGEAVVNDLIQVPRTIRSGEGWREESIGRLPEVFYEVRRLVLETHVPVDCETDGRFQVLNVVGGDGVTIETTAGAHRLNYAETIVLPAAVGDYALRALGKDAVRIVKALIA
jgi:mannose-6-phosphate isomerase class I